MHELYYSIDNSMLFSGSETANYSSFICAGDRANLEMDFNTLSSLPEEVASSASLIADVSLNFRQ